MVIPENYSWRRDLLWLVLVFGLLLGFRLGSYPLDNPDEGRNAEIPREMLATGDWVTPRLNAVNYFEKPPLMYWAVGACMKVFGHSEWALRATPALFALAGILLTYAAARRMYGRTAGLASATVLGTSLLYFGTGRFLVLDMPVSVLMSATLFCFILAVNEPPGIRRRWLFYGLYASAALATLTKGFIGFLVTGAVMFLWLLIFNQWKKLRPMHLPTGLGLFLAIAAPWHVLAAMRNETWAHRYIYYEHWARFTTTEHGRYQPWHYFIWILLGGLFPWMAFIWPAVRNAVRGGPFDGADALTGGQPRDPSRSSGWARRGENATGWFLVTWIAFIFLFFSKSQSKLPAYILPVFPAAAVLIGAWLAEVMADPLGALRLRGSLRVFSFACGLLAVALLVTVLRPGLIIHDAEQALALRIPAVLLALVLIAGGVLVPIVARLRGGIAAFIAIATMAALFLAGLTFAVPYIYKPGTKALALIVKTQVKPGDKVMHYYDFFHDFTFYAEQPVGLIDAKGELELEEDPVARASGRFITSVEFRREWNGSTRFWVVAKKRDAKALFEDPTFHYHLLAQTKGHYLFSNQP
ncbi:MAG: glycosyltransferase family 39 protein [Opitutaceae bacterium]